MVNMVTYFQGSHIPWNSSKLLEDVRSPWNSLFLARTALNLLEFNFLVFGPIKYLIYHYCSAFLGLQTSEFGVIISWFIYHIMLDLELQEICLLFCIQRGLFITLSWFLLHQRNMFVTVNSVSCYTRSMFTTVSGVLSIVRNVLAVLLGACGSITDLPTIFSRVLWISRNMLAILSGVILLDKFHWKSSQILYKRSLQSDHL